MHWAVLNLIQLKVGGVLSIATAASHGDRLWDKLEAIFWFVVNVVLASLLILAPFVIIGGLILLTLTVVVNVGKAWGRLVALAKQQGARLMLLVCLALGQAAIAIM